MTRAALRQQLHRMRDRWVAGRAPADMALAFSVLPSPLRALVARATCVGGYMAMGSEANPARILERIAAAYPHTALALPRHAQRDAVMEFCAWSPGDAVAPGPWRYPQPLADAAVIVPDLLLVPVLGFDRSGNRLGQGGGHYDRYLAAHPGTIAVGIAWSVQAVDAVPVAAHDMPMHAILTECEWICPE